jgi:hypothetical protein
MSTLVTTTLLMTSFVMTDLVMTRCWAVMSILGMSDDWLSDDWRGAGGDTPARQDSNGAHTQLDYLSDDWQYTYHKPRPRPPQAGTSLPDKTYWLEDSAEMRQHREVFPFPREDR